MVFVYQLSWQQAILGHFGFDDQYSMQYQSVYTVSVLRTEMCNDETNIEKFTWGENLSHTTESDADVAFCVFTDTLDGV